jgi:hypothetical protein
MLNKYEYSRVITIGIATGRGKMFPLTMSSRPLLRPTQPHIRGEPENIFPGVKWLGREAHFQLVSRSRKRS